MELGKKISFSFSKSSKPPNISFTKPKEKREVELIDCLEGQSIKIKNATEEIKVPLVIPLRDDAKDLLDRVKQSQLAKTHKMEEDERPDEELTLDELAARELIKEVKNKQVNNSSETKIYSLPTTDNKSTPQNDQESTLNDYENIPISDFGLAVLRGMGWTESTGIGKQNKQVTKPIEPDLRPKGMGLGANKFVNLKKDCPSVDKDGKELTLIKGAYAKVIAGKHNGDYCEVLGLDDESGRIIVKTTIKRMTLSLNEFLVVPVTKEEYIRCGKVINNAAYEKHKEQINSNYSNVSSESSNRRNRSSSEENRSKQTSLEKNRDISKRRDRSESPSYRDTVHKSRYRSRSPTDNYKRKRNKSNYKKRSESPEISDRGHENARKYDSSDEEDYTDKKYNSKSRDENKKLKKKKSKKSKKYKKDSCSSDEEYRKKKSKKTKKYRNVSSNSNSSDDEYSKSRSRHKLNKNHR